MLATVYDPRGIGRDVYEYADEGAVKVLTDAKAYTDMGAAALQNNLDTHTTNKNNPHGVTATQIGLGNVDNTSDANKPLSAAMQTELNAKAPLASPALTGIPTAPTATVGTNTTQLATTAFVLANAPKLTFVYKCTGIADSTAIATLINNFFNSGTAMNMKLIITGTMGVAATSGYAMYLNPTNTRGATVHLDFSDCYIPAITTASTGLLYLGTGVNISVFGLVAKCHIY